jgi:hypothetical protein
MKCACALENKAIWDLRHIVPLTCKRSKVEYYRHLQDCVYVFLIVTRSYKCCCFNAVSHSYFPKMLPIVEITTCSDNP